MIKTHSGFTLVELIIFIVITSILAMTILLSMRMSLQSSPDIHYDAIATQLADRCMEGFIGERHLLGYNDAALACANSAILPTVCTTLTGFTINASIVCSTILSGDTTASKTVQVTVRGLGSATLTSLFAMY